MVHNEKEMILWVLMRYFQVLVPTRIMVSTRKLTNTYEFWLADLAHSWEETRTAPGMILTPQTRGTAPGDPWVDSWHALVETEDLCQINSPSPQKKPPKKTQKAKIRGHTYEQNLPICPKHVRI